MNTVFILQWFDRIYNWNCLTIISVCFFNVCFFFFSHFIFFTLKCFTTFLTIFENIRTATSWMLTWICFLQSWSVLDFWRTKSTTGDPSVNPGWSARRIDFFRRMMTVAVHRSWAVTKYLLKMDEPSELWRVGVKVWSGISSCPPYISLVLLNMSPTDRSSASFLDIFLLSAGNLTWFTDLQMNLIHTPPNSDDFQSKLSCINLPNAFTKICDFSEIYS